MFPTLSDLFEYLFHIHLLLPVQTFGFFVALAFVLSYLVFYSEFKRKEADGWIHAFKRKINTKPHLITELLLNGFLGFILGYKFISIIINFHKFATDPKGYIFSLQGNLITGLLTAAGFFCWVYIDRRKDKSAPTQMKEETVHPYQLMGLFVFSLGFFGFIGAKLFDILEHFYAFWYNPVSMLLNVKGLTYFGGLIFGSLTFLYIGHRYGMKLIHLTDIGSPGMMLAYGVGRIGCQLAGDGDWGIVNLHANPAWLQWLPDWMWSFKFPHNIINTGVPINNCYGSHCYQLPYGVYPTSFYEAFICITLFVMMWSFRRYIRIPGLMFYIYLLLAGSERLLIEQIRINPKYHLGPIAFTQAELICWLMILGGMVGITYIIFNKRIKRYGQLNRY